jgi:hypothetical protein
MLALILFIAFLPAETDDATTPISSEWFRSIHPWMDHVGSPLVGLCCCCDELSTRATTGLLQYVMDVIFDGCQRDAQLFGDLTIAET